MTLRSLLTVVLAVSLLATTALAHGGVYRFPSPGSPLTGGPGGPGPGGPTTGGGSTSTSDSWSQWWEFHKDRYLRVRATVLEGSIENGDQTVDADDPRPTEEQLRDEVIPALVRLLDRSDNRDVATAVLMALGKIGRRHPGHDILGLMSERLTRGNQEIRETAALAIGLSGFPECLELLVDLMDDTPAGRALVRDSEVDRRTRAFATYGLAFLARRADDPALTEAVLSAFERSLPNTDPDERDRRTALVHGLGLLVPSLESSEGTLQRLRILKLLDDAATLKMSRGDQVILAHVFSAAAHALGRGDTVDHRRWKDRMIETLEPREDAHVFVREAAVLALGDLCEPPEVSEAAKARSEKLQEAATEDKDQLTQRFALMALARIGGVENRDFLIRRHRSGKRGTEKPWAAIALGVFARERELRGLLPDAVIPGELLRGFADVQSGEYPSACAVALGLCREKTAEPLLRKAVRKAKNQDLRAGYIALALCLVGEPAGVAEVRELLGEATHRPLLMTQAAIGLAVAHDEEGRIELARQLTEEAESLAELAALASAFRFVGDRRIVPALIRRVDSDTGTTLARAFAAAALGGVCDPRTFPWNAPLAEGTSYLAPIATLIDGARGVLDIL